MKVVFVRFEDKDRDSVAFYHTKNLFGTEDLDEIEALIRFGKEAKAALEAIDQQADVYD